MEKEWWNKAIKRLEDMPVEEFAKLVEKVDEVQFPFPAENIVLPKNEKECGYRCIAGAYFIMRGSMR